MSLHKNFFYHEHLRKLIVAFGSIFNDLTFVRFNKDGSISKIVKPVPIQYLSKDKFISLSEKNIEILPRMSFIMTGMEFSEERMLNKFNRIQKRIDKNKSIKVGSPVPYDISFDLNIGGKRSLDVFQIVEQIIPHFQPDLNLSMRDVPLENHVIDVPVILNSIDFDDNFDDPLSESTRLFTATLSFVARYHFYPNASSERERDVSEKLFGTREIESDMNHIRTIEVNEYYSSEFFYDNMKADRTTKIDG